MRQLTQLTGTLQLEPWRYKQMALEINPDTGTIQNEGGGGITLDPGASELVTVANGMLFPDGTVAEPGIRFDDDVNTGMYSPVNDTIGLAGHGADIMRLHGVTSAVNYLDVTPAVTASNVLLKVDGSDTNIGLDISSKGTGTVKIDGLSYPTSDGTANQFMQTDGAGNLTFADAGATGYHYSGTITTAPTGTGEDTIVIGEAAVGGTATDSTAIGKSCKVGSYGSVAIGENSWAQGANSVAMGASARASGTYAVGIGKSANSTKGVAIGANCNTNDTGAVAISDYAKAYGHSQISIGRYAGNTTTAYNNTVCIGQSVTATAANQMRIGVSATEFVEYTGSNLTLNGTAAQYVLPSYTVATVPTGTTGGMIYVTDGNAGAASAAIYDGTNWKVIALGATISAT